VLHHELTRVWAEQNLSVVFVTHNVREAAVLGPQPRTIESPEVSSLAGEITRELHQEISRHGQ
jgi:NitT/TauT family transport system ATP-binding protein